MNKPIDLSVSMSTMTTSFHSPVEMNYSLNVNFQFPSEEIKLISEIVGDRYSEECRGDISYDEIPKNRRAGLGRPIPFKVIIRKNSDSSIIFEHTFISLCSSSYKTRTIGLIPLVAGDFVAEVINLEAQTDLTNVKTTFSLNSRTGK